MDDATPTPRRIRLTGDRFDGGRLPIDSLAELQKFQSLLRALTVSKWKTAHPGEEVPTDLESDTSLAIERIENGSADIFLIPEQHQIYVQYQEEAQSILSATIAAAYRNEPIPDLPDEVSEQIRAGVIEFGETLEGGQAIEVYVDGVDRPPVTVTVATRKDAVAKLQLDGFLLSEDPQEANSTLVRIEEAITGQIIELNPEEKKYQIATSDSRTINGRYVDNPGFKDDFLRVLNESAEGPLVRITGEVRYRNGKPLTIWTTSKVEYIEVVHPRLIELASLKSGWGDSGDEAVVSFPTVEAAASTILHALKEASRQDPGIVATPDGGLLLEWASARSVRSIEITPNLEFEMFWLPEGTFDAQQSTTTNLDEATTFAIGAP